MTDQYEIDRNARLYAEAQAQARLDVLTDCVKVELQKLGINCALDNAKSEGNPDARFIKFDDFNVRASYVTYGANKGRIQWGGYMVPRKSPGDSHYSRPRLADTSSAPDAPASRIAKAIVSRIIEPSAADRAKYHATCDEWDKRAEALPQQIATVNKMGFDCKAALSETEAGFYISRKGADGTARINSEGKVYFDRLSLDAETGRCVLEFLAARGAK